MNTVNTLIGPIHYPNRRGKRMDPAIKVILSEKEKFDDEMALIKERFNFLETTGWVQVEAKQQRYRKLYDHAFSRIDPEDYVKTEEILKDLTGKSLPDLHLMNLKYYPIIPLIYNAIMAARGQMYVKYSASAVNPEATSELLKRLDEQLRSVLIQNLMALFMSENEGLEPDVAKQRMQMIAEGEEAKKINAKTYRSTVEEWAVHRMNVEDMAFSMKQLEQQVLSQLIVTGDPVVHIDHKGDYYRPEVINEANTFWLKSDKSDDYSESEYFGWFEDLTFSDILNRFSSDLDVEEIEAMADGTTLANSSLAYNYSGQYFSKGQRLAEVRQNLNFFRSLQSKYGMDSDFTGNFWKLTTIYFYVPRKIGILTAVVDGNKVVDIVDERARVIVPPIYRKGKPKTEENLIAGEHIKWTYINELWRGRKVSPNIGSGNWSGIVSKLNELGDKIEDSEIWVELGKCEIQHNDPYLRYSVRIPVHGGSPSSTFGHIDSLLERAVPWQIDFNWLQNRRTQIAQSDLGKFLMLPETLIPQDNLYEADGKDKLVDFGETARDVGIVGTANPATANGAGIVAQQGYGQVVDLNRMDEMTKIMQLAAAMARECFAAVGLTPEYVLGSIAPTQSAVTAGMGQQRVSSQLVTLFDRLDSIMQKVRTTMIQTAKHIASTNPSVQISYMTGPDQRQVFTSSTEDFSLADLAIFASSNAADVSVMERIRQYVASNNTMGADSLELSYLMTFKTLPELFSKLRDLRAEKEANEAKKYQQEMTLAQERTRGMIEQERMKLQQEAEQKELDRRADLMGKQIIALGYSDGSTNEVLSSLLKLKEADSDQKRLYDQMERDARADSNKMSAESARHNLNLENSLFRRQIELKKLGQKDRELQIAAERVKATSQRTRAID